VGENCSLVDLLPTLIDLAVDGKPSALVDHCDGHSLGALLHGSDSGWVDEALIEFTGEGVYAPALILRQGRYKYVYCEGDPGMLFDLQKDPSELRNLCQDPAFASTAQRFVQQIEQRYQPAQIKQRVLASQRRRLFLHETLTKGTYTPWDFQVRKDGSRQYVRSVSTTSTTATKAKARFPFVPTVPPDMPRTPGK
jgi:choline-sulfatase